MTTENVLRNHLYDRSYGEGQARTIPSEYKKIITRWLELNSGDRVLELGVGSGDLLNYLRHYTERVFGLDINREYIMAHLMRNVTIMDARVLGICDQSVDKSISLHLLEHFETTVQVKQAMLELDRITTDGGLSFHAFPHPTFHRVEATIGDAFHQTKNPIKAWELMGRLHPIELTPKILNAQLVGTNWEIMEAQSILVPSELTRAWVVLLRK